MLGLVRSAVQLPVSFITRLRLLMYMCRSFLILIRLFNRTGPGNPGLDRLSDLLQYLIDQLGPMLPQDGGPAPLHSTALAPPRGVHLPVRLLFGVRPRPQVQGRPPARRKRRARQGVLPLDASLEHVPAVLDAGLLRDADRAPVPGHPPLGVQPLVPGPAADQGPENP